MNDPWTTLLIAAFSALIAFIMGGVRQRISDESSLVKEIAERYISETANEPFHDPQAFRLGAMQRSGVALFKTKRQLRKFFRIVMGRGREHPLKDQFLNKFFPEDKITTFLRAASEEGISLSSDVAIYQFILHCFTVKNPKKPKNAL